MNEPLPRRLFRGVRQLTTTQWIFLIAALITIAGVPTSLIRKMTSIHAAILAVWVCLLLGLSWTLLVVQEFRYSRKARYGEALSDLHSAFHKLSETWHSMQHTGPAGTQFQIALLQQSLSSFSSAFSIITGVHCRACIKTLSCPDPKVEPKARALIVETLSRSEDIPEPKAEYPQDYVSDNTDFLTLFRGPNEPCFFSNDLTKKRNYKNSHWTKATWETRQFDYISTIVWPITNPLHVPPQQEDALHESPAIVGFLCVDSLARGAFRKRTDYPLGAAYADALYVVLKSSG